MFELLNARQVGEMLGVSWRTVYRLADCGEIPWGMKVGATLRRWPRLIIESYIRGRFAECGKDDE